jgi:hypothetical protein
MRPRSGIVSTARLCAVMGLGAYLGVSIAGAMSVITGRVFAPGDGWLALVPGLAVVGAGLGAAVCWLTRSWLLRRIAGRWWAFAGAGIVTLPLFTAIGFGQSDTIASVAVVLAVLVGVAMLVAYRRASPRSVGRYSPPRSR